MELETNINKQAVHFDALKVMTIIMKVVVLLYFFLIGVSVLGGSFKLLGSGFAKELLNVTNNPFIGLISGMLATTLFQSSSVTTSIVVGFVAGGALSLNNAIPMIMGANLGTSVTNTLVSLAFAKNKSQFSKAISAATVHDFFNILSVAILLPLEIMTSFLEKSALFFSNAMFGGSAGVKFSSPVKAAIKPVSKGIIGFFKDILPATAAGTALIVFSAIIITLALYFIVRTTRVIVESNKGDIIESLLTKNPYISVFFGMILTIGVQSSSITTSLLVPMAGAGLITLNSVLPVTVGANIGTTATAMLAALAGNISGLAIALVHFLFNVCGMLIWFVHPTMRKFPVYLAEKLGELSGKKRRIGLCYVVLTFFVIPLALMLIFR